MRLTLVQRILGLFLGLFSITLIPPLLVALWYQDGELRDFGITFALTLVTGLLLYLPVRNMRQELRTREGFVVVAMFWLVLGMISSLPLHFGSHLGFVDALFESVSGFTTTGATVITGLDALPRSILFYRAELQWLGGMGVIVLAVAILPMLGVGGMQLYRAETPGPMKDEKITPRLAHTARAFWFIYAGLTMMCALGYWGAGMSLFDAVTHSFATISTGGFSTHDASMSYFHSTYIEVIAIVFMAMGGINFSIHYLVWARGAPESYWRDTEVRTFILTLVGLTLILTLGLVLNHFNEDFFSALRESAFQAVSVMTSTGFTTTNFAVWPLFLPALLMMSSFIGGCAGSTAGGMKVIRFVILYKQSHRDLRRLVHPNMVDKLKVGGRVLPDRAVAAVWGFFAMYVATFTVLMLLLMASGLDQVTAFSAIATCINNLGPGLGEVTSNFQSVNAFAKLVCTAAMLLGRLEVFTVLVLLTPAFWRR
jgi:trk system potassium uptake protein TrkH